MLNLGDEGRDLPQELARRESSFLGRPAQQPGTEQQVVDRIHHAAPVEQDSLRDL
jgi:hypothetical protein